MASSYTSGLRIEKPGAGDYLNNWAGPAAQIFDLFDDAITGITNITTTGGTVTLSVANGTADEARRPILKVVGALTANAVIALPNVSRHFQVINATTGAYSLTIKAGSGATSAVVPQGKTANLLSDGANNIIFSASPTAQDGKVDPNALPLGSTTSPGVVQVSSDVVAVAGTDTSVVVTAKQLGDLRTDLTTNGNANDGTARSAAATAQTTATGAQTAATNAQTTANAALPKNGSVPMTGALQMGSNKVTGVAPGAAAGEVATFDQLPTAFGASGAAHKAGLVPDPGAVAGATRFLREDGTFAVPPAGAAGAVMTGATATVAGTPGSAPGPAAGDQDKFLKGDGTWAGLPERLSGGAYVTDANQISLFGVYRIDASAGNNAPNSTSSFYILHYPVYANPMLLALQRAIQIDSTSGFVEYTREQNGAVWGPWVQVGGSPVMTGATATVAGAAGSVPAPAAGDDTKLLRGDGTWIVPSITTAAGSPTTGAGTTASPLTFLNFVASGASNARGLVPAPGATAGTAKFLREDATWNTVLGSIDFTGLTGTQKQNISTGLVGDSTSLSTLRTGIGSLVEDVSASGAISSLGTNLGVSIQKGWIMVSLIGATSTGGGVQLSRNGGATYTGIVTTSDSGAGIGILIFSPTHVGVAAFKADGITTSSSSRITPTNNGSNTFLRVTGGATGSYVIIATQ